MLKQIPISIRRASAAEQKIVHHLVQLYLHDFSEFEDKDVGDDGLYLYEELPQFWSEPSRHPFLARYNNILAGFALVQQGFHHEEKNNFDEHLIDMVDFFVMRKYRRKGVGRVMAHYCFNIIRGPWQVRTDDYNPTASIFWQRVIQEFSGGNYKVHRPADQPGTTYYFNS